VKIGKKDWEKDWTKDFQFAIYHEDDKEEGSNKDLGMDGDVS
jgi:hypothetical protein